MRCVALLAEGVDRNLDLGEHAAITQVALLAEGVDRNIDRIRTLSTGYNVALLAEGVDRNALGFGLAFSVAVALLAEGVDRNGRSRRGGLFIRVALLAEGVDRNTLRLRRYSVVQGSPSSRRAWIEINPAVIALDAVCGRPPRGGRG